MKKVLILMLALTSFFASAKSEELQNVKLPNKIYACYPLFNGIKDVGQFIKVLKIDTSKGLNEIKLTRKFMVENHNWSVMSEEEREGYEYGNLPLRSKLALKLNGYNFFDKKGKAYFTEKFIAEGNTVVRYNLKTQNEGEVSPDLDFISNENGDLDLVRFNGSPYNLNYGPCHFLNK